jgi:polysaccharide export outer membrane protein
MFERSFRSRRRYVLVSQEPRWRVVRRLAVLVGLLAGLAHPGSALGQGQLGEMRRQTSREELEKLAKASETAARSAPDAKTRQTLLQQADAIRQRLRNGDFLPGDRILLQVLGDSLLSDTFTVRIDRRLQLPNIPEISLHGVLDSELQPYLQQELSKYLREPRVTAIALVRISVLGAVTQPRFMTVPVDQALTDVINGAGPTAASDLSKAVVRRGSDVLLDSKALQAALRQGKTVGDVGMRDGDEIFVPAQVTTSGTFERVLSIVGALGTVLYLVRYAR